MITSIIHIRFWQLEAEKIALARGLRFCLPPKKVDGHDAKCSFELLFRDLKKFGPPLTTENQDRLKCQLKHISCHHIYSYDFSKQIHNLSKEEWEALTDLRKDDSIIITKPDKGNGVVIINKLDYLNKMKLLILDATKLKKLTQNPTKFREDSLISYLCKLKNRIKSLMMPPFIRYYHVVLPLVSSMAFLRFINLVALSALLSLQ